MSLISLNIHYISISMLLRHLSNCAHTSVYIASFVGRDHAHAFILPVLAWGPDILRILNYYVIPHFSS